jgi:murein L,D-transpeptidase YcbB/YkuD
MGVRIAGALISVAAVLCGPAAHAVEVALAPPFENTSPEVQLDAVVLSPIAQAIQSNLAAQTSLRGSLEAAILDQVRTLYETRNFEPLWIRDGVASDQAQALRTRMAAAEADGLDPSVYGSEGIASFAAPDPASLAAAEVQFARAVSLYVTHLASGRLAPAAISKIITQVPERPDLAEVLPRLARSTAIAADLKGYEPPHPEYAALKSALAAIRRAEAAEPSVVLPEGSTLRPGTRDARVPLLRARLGVAAPDRDGDASVMDEAVTAALRAFQAVNRLEADGVLGPRSIAALNGRNRADQIAGIIANMERWRWMPRDLGGFHVAVNVPEFMVRVRRDGKVMHETRVVVGTPANPTPLFSHSMDHLVVNPFWNVPTSILKNEMLSEIQADPSGYFARRGYQVLAQAGGAMRVVDPASINWWAVKPGSVRVRQVPGDDNALGRIKFMFPNQHSVYLHDTPSKKLFQRDFRAYSHGCVRVDNPLEFADAILAVGAPDWNSKRLEKLYGGPERRINLAKPIPVHLAYFTASVEPDGAVRWFDDIYGFDKRMAEALGL